MSRTVLIVSALSFGLAPAYAQTEAIERLASRLSEAPLTEDSVDGPQHLPVRTIVYAGAGREPERVGATATETVRYQYDDNSFDGGIGPFGDAALQAAQRFRLRDEGTVRWLEACFSRTLFSSDPDHSFSFDILSDHDGSPGSSLIRGRRPQTSGQIAPWPYNACLRLDYSHRLSADYVWVAVLFFAKPGNPLAGTHLEVDTGTPRDTTVRARNASVNKDGEVTDVGPWQTVALPDLDGSTIDVGALGIRMAVDHEIGTSPPDPDPPAPGPCVPTTDVLQFDGGYRVSMCYVTHQGDTGQARAGVWASGQSGILWFFSRENAEVLVKVLDGCEHNGHRWVFVAPVTDVGFELRVTAPDGEIWTHVNQAGTTAATRSDTSAFVCQGQ